MKQWFIKTRFLIPCVILSTFIFIGFLGKHIQLRTSGREPVDISFGTAEWFVFSLFMAILLVTPLMHFRLKMRKNCSACGGGLIWKSKAEFEERKPSTAGGGLAFAWAALMATMGQFYYCSNCNSEYCYNAFIGWNPPHFSQKILVYISISLIIFFTLIGLLLKA